MLDAVYWINQLHGKLLLPLLLLRAVITLIGRRNILAINTFFFHYGSILSASLYIFPAREWR